MVYIDRDLLLLKVKQANTTYEAIYTELGINRSTWYRQLRKGTISIAHVNRIVVMLGLSAKDIIDVFFTPKVA
jgi:hypothetical protein